MQIIQEHNNTLELNQEEKKKKRNEVTFFQAESLILNTLLIILSYTFHPFATHNYM
jgi:hypothetical protein